MRRGVAAYGDYGQGTHRDTGVQQIVLDEHARASVGNGTLLQVLHGESNALGGVRRKGVSFSEPAFGEPCPHDVLPDRFLGLTTVHGVQLQERLALSSLEAA